jgi:hypothetical protein
MESSGKKPASRQDAGSRPASPVKGQTSSKIPTAAPPPTPSPFQSTSFTPQTFPPGPSSTFGAPPPTAPRYTQPWRDTTAADDGHIAEDSTHSTAPPRGHLTDTDILALIRTYQHIGQLTPPKPERPKKYWKTTDVGFFWPDMPLSYGIGRIVDYDGSRYFRDVNSFVSQIKDTIPYYGAEVVRNNIHNCFKGQAFTWYSDVLNQTTKMGLRNDSCDECSYWTKTLLDNFRLSGSQAMKKITSEHTKYTMQMLKDGASLVSWFTDMISLANDAEFANDKQVLRFVWYKMDAELRSKLPPLRDNDSVQSYLVDLRNAEENIREAVTAQDRRLANEWRNPYIRSRGFTSWNRTQPRPYVPAATDSAAFRPYASAETTGDKPSWPAVQPGTQAPTNQQANRTFPQFIPQAFGRQPEQRDQQGKTASNEAYRRGPNDQPKLQYEPARRADNVRNRAGPAWNSGIFAARRDNFRVNPKHTCRFCGGYHYDSVTGQ